MSSETAPVMILAGGTGGHIFPGLAVAACLQRRGVPVVWLGSRHGLETRLVPAAGIELTRIEVRGLRGKGLFGWLAAPWRLTRALLQALRAVHRARPRAVLSLGGYAAGPGGVAAWLLRHWLVVHEQNRIPGLTNRLLARLARRVVTGFPDSFPGWANAHHCGNPVREDVAALPDPDERAVGQRGRLRLLVLGGSQGARALNERLPQALGTMAEASRPWVRHQAGRDRATVTAGAYGRAGVKDSEVTAFIEDMAEAYAWADLVVARAGALTVAELAAAGIGSILVPFPYAVDDHQARNAAFLVDAGAAEMRREEALEPQELAALLASLDRDRDQVQAMARNARALAMPAAADCVAMHCLREVPA